MNLDTEIFYFINHDLQNPVFDAIMPNLTNFGGFVTLLSACIVAVILLKYFKKDRYLEIAKICLIALILSGIIAACVKLLVHQPRPFAVLENVRQLTIPSESNSFPSGHTSSTLSIITVLVWKFRDKKWLVALLACFGFLIGFSRIYCGVHFPHDILAGALIGIISGVVVLKLKKQF